MAQVPGALAAAADLDALLSAWQSVKTAVFWHVLASLGLYAQRRYELPLVLRALLTPAYLLEASLRGVALKLTNDDFTRARATARVN